MTVSIARFIPAAILIALGILIMVIGVTGVFRIRYVLNRLHAAAMGDSLGIFLVALGVIILYGISIEALKVIFVVVIFWVASPTCSHLLSRLEASTNDDLKNECEVPEE